MSYQSEERYWTDYLRIALPIVGLLLLLSVFWYWASSFIGDDGDDPQTPIAEVETTPITAPTVTPTEETTNQIPVNTVEPTEAAAITISTEDADDTASDQPDPTEPPDTGEPAGNGGLFSEGEIVVVNENDLNMRSEPTTNSDIIDTLVLGSELRILDVNSVDADGFTWWNVEDIINETQGWVAQDFIDKLE